MLKVALHSDLKKLHLIQILALWDWRQQFWFGSGSQRCPLQRGCVSHHVTALIRTKTKTSRCRYSMYHEPPTKSWKCVLEIERSMILLKALKLRCMFTCGKTRSHQVFIHSHTHTHRHPCTSENTHTHTMACPALPLYVCVSLQLCLLYLLSS